ncbi:MAG: trypsin-like peptidase domain-containing protein [Alphaproteobacteria bacterium]
MKKICICFIFIFASSLVVLSGVWRPKIQNFKDNTVKEKQEHPKESQIEKNDSVLALEAVSQGDLIPNNFSGIAESTLPAVVNLTTTQIIENKDQFLDLPRGVPLGSFFEDFFRGFFGGGGIEKMPRRVQSLGSGFIVRSDDKVAYIVTNYHVIADAKEIKIFFHNKKEIESKVHAVDERTDIAVLKVDISSLKKGSISVIKWGDSQEVHVGEWVLAIGNPFGLGSTVTAGIVSFKGRDRLVFPKDKADYIYDFIQHSAQINAGNSGGCLLNMRGEVIGVNIAISSPSGGNVGIGFATPSKLVKQVVDDLIKSGRIKRGWLGVHVQFFNDEMAESLGVEAVGVIVGDIVSGGPADKAGIKKDDIITEFDGKPINHENKIMWIVGETPIGKECKVKVLRKKGGKLEENILKVVVGDFEEAQKEGKLPIKPSSKEQISQTEITILGMHIASITPTVRKMLGIKDDIKGVYIADIGHRSNAIESGLIRGDIISEANQQSVDSPKTLETIIKKAKKQGRKNVFLYIIRREKRFYCALSINISSDESLSNGKKGCCEN